jgi:hypothetical protein
VSDDPDDGAGTDPNDPSGWIKKPKGGGNGGDETGGGKANGEDHPQGREAANYGDQKAPAEVLELLFGEEALVAPLHQDTVVRGVLHRGSITVIYGPPKSGKSFLASDLAVAVADEQRERWMEHRIMQHGVVVYVACEGHGGYWKRLRAMLNVDQRMPDRFVLAKGRPKLIVDDSGRGYHWIPHPDDIIKGIKRVHARLGQFPILVVIDTVFRSFGGANVNDSSHMNQYVAAAQGIADNGAGNVDDNGANTRVAVVLVHHSTKAGNTPAGSISLIGAADTLIAVRKDADAHVWEVEEAKDDAETPPREFVLEVVDGIADAFGDYVSSCKVVDRGLRKQEAKPSRTQAPKEPKPPKPPKARSPYAELVYQALVTLFDKPDVPQEREITPGMPPMLSVTRDQLKEQLRVEGLITGTLTGGMTGHERGWLRDKLVSLVTRKEIVMNSEAIALSNPDCAIE